jgi:competence protein ComEC
MLIDAGPPQAGKNYLLPLLKELGIEKIDALIVTHYDADHLGGVPSLLAGEDGMIGTEDDFPVRAVYDRGGTPWDNSPAYLPYVEAIAVLRIPRYALQAGQRLALDPDTLIHCVAVNGVVDAGGGNQAIVDLSPSTYSSQENAASVALLIQVENFRYLTAGDLTGGASLNGFLTPDVETLLADAVGEVDALHVNHHGSLSSSNQHYVNRTSPEAVFIQAGVGNPYGHPAWEVMKRWKNIGAEIYSTEEGKGYWVTTDGQEYKVNPIEK